MTEVDGDSDSDDMPPLIDANADSSDVRCFLMI